MKMRSSGRKLSFLFWLLGTCCSCLVSAKTLCDEGFRTDHIEIQFVPPTSEIPQSFMVTYGTQNSEARVTRGADGAWRGSLSNAGVIGNQDMIGLRLSLAYHEVKPNLGYNQSLDGTCYAVYKVHVNHTAWILEVDASPDSPFYYRKNAKESWTRRGPESQEPAWNRVQSLGIKEFLDIQIWETSGVEATYLFTIPDVAPSTVGAKEFDRDKIAAQIVKERAAIINNKLNLKTTSVPPNDPYLKKLRLPGAPALGEEALKAIIMNQIILRQLKLKDASEVSP
jgi:hypothetical protein